jgi:hypothetical protein
MITSCNSPELANDLYETVKSYPQTSMIASVLSITGIRISGPAFCVDRHDMLSAFGIDGECLILKVLTPTTAKSGNVLLSYAHAERRSEMFAEELAVELFGLSTCSRALVQAEVVRVVDGDQIFRAIKMPQYASTLQFFS